MTDKSNGTAVPQEVAALAQQAGVATQPPHPSDTSPVVVYKTRRRAHAALPSDVPSS